MNSKKQDPKKPDSHLKPLCLARSLGDLGVLVQEDEAIKNIKSIYKYGYMPGTICF